MKVGRCIWTSLGIIANVLTCCSSYDNGGFIEDCAENEIMFGCKDEGDIIVIKDAWIHPKYYKVPKTSCHIPEYNVQFKIESVLHLMNKMCASNYLCKFNLFEDFPVTQSKYKWRDGVIQLEYECVLDTTIRRTCGVKIEEQEGWLKNVGYPKYYLGPGACTFTINVDEGQHIHLTIYDLYLKEISRPRETACSDELTINEGQKQLFSKCGILNQPVNIISRNNTLNVTLHSGAEVFVNRGFIIHFKAIGCHTPVDPDGGFLSYRDKDIAEFQCSDESLFPDTLARKRSLRCLRRSKWNLELPNCVHLEDLLTSGNITQDDYLKYNGSVLASKNSKNDVFYVVIIPSVIMCILIVGNVGILLLIAVCRRKSKNKFEELAETKDENNASMSNKI